MLASHPKYEAANAVKDCSGRRDDIAVACPSDEMLRSLLNNADQTTNSTEVLSHLSNCYDCQGRVAGWNEHPRLSALLGAAMNSDIECLTPAAFDITPGEPDALTSAYGPVPFREIGNYRLVKKIGGGGGG